MNYIIDAITSFIPSHHRSTSGGWVSFNCIACTHNGHRSDTRHRGGIIYNTDTIGYSCFNCGFKARWQVGTKLSNNMKNLMIWLGLPDDIINKCKLEAIRLNDPNHKNEVLQQLMPEFFPRDLPNGSRLISSWLDDTPENLIPILNYLKTRNLCLDDCNWYWSDDSSFKDRLIIPFYYRSKLVGYTARSINKNAKLKYISDQQTSYVYNLDKQNYNKKFAILCEGPFDAISIDGISTLGNSINAGQRLLISQLQREIIVVPDRDIAGKTLLNVAKDCKWSVSFPDWHPDIKDVNDAVIKYGRLYTLHSILNARHTNEIKIKLLSKTWFRK
jgi:hypothetical protein